VELPWKCWKVKNCQVWLRWKINNLDQSQKILLEFEKQQALFPWMHEEIGFMLAYINPDL
jgi:hypothetical protein